MSAAGLLSIAALKLRRLGRAAIGRNRREPISGRWLVAASIFAYLIGICSLVTSIASSELLPENVYATSAEPVANLLHEMSLKTHFIVITHAKRTLESEQIMYGVTMREPGMSQLVSVRLPRASAPLRWGA